MQDTVYELNHVFFSYEHTPVLQDVSLWVDQGDYIGIIGSNGGGKSTLMRLLTGELKADQGQLRVFGHSTFQKEDRLKIAYVPQMNPTDEGTFPLSCWELVATGLVGGLFPRFYLREEDRKKVDFSLRHLGMEAYRDQNFHALSGGQRQRILIAKALVNEPKVLLLDEPTVGIDEAYKQILFETLDHMNQVHHITVIMVTHEVDLGQAHWKKTFRIAHHGLEVLCSPMLL